MNHCKRCGYETSNGEVCLVCQKTPEKCDLCGGVIGPWPTYRQAKWMCLECFMGGGAGKAYETIRELRAAIDTITRERDEAVKRADFYCCKQDALQLQLDSLNAAMKEGAEAEVARLKQGQDEDMKRCYELEDKVNELTAAIRRHRKAYLAAGSLPDDLATDFDKELWAAAGKEA